MVTGSALWRQLVRAWSNITSSFHQHHTHLIDITSWSLILDLPPCKKTYWFTVRGLRLVSSSFSLLKKSTLLYKQKKHARAGSAFCASANDRPSHWLCAAHGRQSAHQLVVRFPSKAYMAGPCKSKVIGGSNGLTSRFQQLQHHSCVWDKQTNGTQNTYCITWRN